MKRSALIWLTAVNLALIGSLMALWVTPQGQLRSVVWQRPILIKPVLPDLPVLQDWNSDIGRYLATLDRPLFATTRRPPPKPQVEALPPDTLADALLLGVYGLESTGGMIARINGQVFRTKVGESVAGWTLKEVRASGAALVRGDEIRTLEIKRSDLGNSTASTPSASVPTVASANSESRRQQELELTRERVRQMNRIRARMKLPPLPEP